MARYLNWNNFHQNEWSDKNGTYFIWIPEGQNYKEMPKYKNVGKAFKPFLHFYILLVLKYQ